MCGGDYFRSKSGRMITLEKFKTMAANLKLENVGAIVLAGAGDPLLNKDLIQIIQFVKKTYPHISISVTTNGLALSATLSGHLIESEVAQVNISINSATRVSYKRIMQIDGFDMVCKNAKSFIEQRNKSGKPVALQFSAAINRLNIEDLPRLVEVGREIGINSINLFYTRFYPERIRHTNIEEPANRLENNASLFFHQKLSDEMVLKAKTLARQYGIGLTHEPLFVEHATPCVCTWPMMQLMVGFDGEIYPCGGSEVHFREKVESGSYDFGNVLHSPVDAFWNSEPYRALRISSQQGETCSIPECRSCGNTISPNDIGSHIMQWDMEGSEIGPESIKNQWDVLLKSIDAISPLFSVIVPTYNRPDWLAVALKSILEQTYGNIEIVVVNDCGADVENIISSLNKNNNIVYIRHNRNRGLAAARNTGIRNASGQYVALLDDDDIFYPTHLETAVGELSEYQQVIYTDAVRATYQKTENGYKLTGKHVAYSMDYDRNKLLLGNISPVNCFVFDRNLALRAGLFDESMSTLEDWDFWIRLSALTPFKHIKKPTVQVNWRTDGTTMTSSRQSEFIKNRETINNKNRSAINMIPNRKEIMAEFQAIWSGDSSGGVQHVPAAVKTEILKNIVSIIILVHNQLEHTRLCLESIEKYTPEAHEIIIVDNASTDGTPDYLLQYRSAHPNVQVIFNKENRGFAAGNNQGLVLAGGEYVLLLNNDTVVTHGWLTRMLAVFRNHPEAGLVGPTSNYVSGPQLINNVPYKNMKQMHRFAMQLADKYRGQSDEIFRVVGFCLMARRAVVDRIGGLDEKFGAGNFEDDDFCIRAAIAGFKARIAKDVFIHHIGGQTFDALNIDYQQSLEKNWGIFKTKWNIPAVTPYGSYSISLTTSDPSKYYIPLPFETELSSSSVKKNAGEESYSVDDEKEITENLYKKAVLLQEKGETDLAIRQFEIILKIDKDNPEVHNDVGVLYFQQENIEKAIYHLLQAVKLDSENIDYKKNIADVYSQTERGEEAVNYYEDILNISPNDVETLLAMARLCSHAGLEQDAHLYLNKVLEIEPDNEYAKQYLQTEL
jgi:GT2 family glycosyltransferase/MoaA/NifB/PqqE/SkfB family radical SAM enzyme